MDERDSSCLGRELSDLQSLIVAEQDRVRALLKSDGVSDDELASLRTAIESQGDPAKLVDDSEFVLDILREIMGPSCAPKLTPDGWLVPALGEQEVRTVWHIYALASLTISSDFTLSRDDAASRAAQITALAREASELAHAGSVGRATRALEQRARSKRAAKGARRSKIHASELNKFRENWIARHGKERGWKSAAAAHFGVTDTAIRKRLRAVENSNPPS